jgi:hypothetical protein
LKQNLRNREEENLSLIQRLRSTETTSNVDSNRQVNELTQNISYLRNENENLKRKINDLTVNTSNIGR